MAPCPPCVRLCMVATPNSNKLESRKIDNGFCILTETPIFLNVSVCNNR